MRQEAAERAREAAAQAGLKLKEYVASLAAAGGVSTTTDGPSSSPAVAAALGPGSDSLTHRPEVQPAELDAADAPTAPGVNRPPEDSVESGGRGMQAAAEQASLSGLQPGLPMGGDPPR